MKIYKNTCKSLVTVLLFHTVVEESKQQKDCLFSFRLKLDFISLTGGNCREIVVKF